MVFREIKVVIIDKDCFAPVGDFVTSIHDSVGTRNDGSFKVTFV